ncbi:MAG: alpha/beta hydrolase [Acidobacteriota bacterium]|nr:MAG: alpha/beta hydrolase [Acidobacteriota bacterium]
MRKISLLITLCLAMVSVAAHAQEKPKDGYFTTKDGVKIHYLIQGKGTPVVLIHGYTGSAYGNWFRNGVAQALVKNHQVVAIDCRNHGLSDKPDGPTGFGKAEDVIEMIDHLRIQRAHFHGYSMGGAIVGRLLGMIPERMITASFGGSGIIEVEEEMRAKMPVDKQGTDPQEAEALRTLRIRRAMDLGMSKEEAEKAADAPRPVRTAPAARPAAATARPQLDLSKLKNMPMLAINGEYDRPLAKTHRMWRELNNFTNVVLDGKSHNTAIMAGYIPPLYIKALANFINANDPE